MATALAFRRDGRRSRLYFQSRPENYAAPSLMRFLRALQRHFRGQRVILVWDRLPAHRSRALATCLAQKWPRLTVEWLPSHAPELNPVEYLWGNLKGRELANLCAADLAGTGRAVRTGMVRVRRQPQLSVAILKHAGLSF